MDADMVIDLATAGPDAHVMTGDPALVALAEAVNRLTEHMAVFRIQQDMIMHELGELRDAIGLPPPIDMADLTPPEQAVVKALAAAWRDSQPNAPRTFPISQRAEYSPRQTLSILTRLAERGVIRRNNRISWMPLNRHLA